jgi:hypothetical protein
MKDILDAVLLLALPASGKSEIRRYLASLSDEERRRDLRLGPLVQLDDFPYVHIMRRADDELARLGRERMFFESPEKPFKDPRDWGTLIHLLNEDYLTLMGGARPGGPGRADVPVPYWKRRPKGLLERIDAASAKAGIGPRLARWKGLLDLGPEPEVHGTSLEGKTLIVEFARGGPRGARTPLPAPLGYRHSLGLLLPEILSKAAVLYVWVTPEQSRRKNRERADPLDPGSILSHGVPEEVMENDYGCDDADWLEANARIPKTIPVDRGGKPFDLPFARFDNRVDKTSFLRGDPGGWRAEEVRAVREGLREALASLG